MSGTVATTMRAHVSATVTACPEFAAIHARFDPAGGGTVTVTVAVRVEVSVIVSVSVPVGEMVRLAVRVAVDVDVSESVGLPGMPVDVTVGVPVAVGLALGVAEFGGVCVAVALCGAVSEGVAVAVPVRVWLGGTTVAEPVRVADRLAVELDVNDGIDTGVAVALGGGAAVGVAVAGFQVRDVVQAAGKIVAAMARRRKRPTRRR